MRASRSRSINNRSDKSVFKHNFHCDVVILHDEIANRCSSLTNIDVRKCIADERR